MHNLQDTNWEALKRGGMTQDESMLAGRYTQITAVNCSFIQLQAETQIYTQSRQVVQKGKCSMGFDSCLLDRFNSMHEYTTNMHGAIKTRIKYFKEEWHADGNDLDALSFGVIYRPYDRSIFPVKNHGLVFIEDPSKYGFDYEGELCALHFYYDSDIDELELGSNWREHVKLMSHRGSYFLPVSVAQRSV